MQIPVLCAVVASVAAGAAAAEEARRVGPAEPKAAVPVVRYESAFTRYRPYTEEKLASWREVNEEMRRLGGHTGHVPAAGARDTNAGERPPHAAQGAHK